MKLLGAKLRQYPTRCHSSAPPAKSRRLRNSFVESRLFSHNFALPFSKCSCTDSRLSRLIRKRLTTAPHLIANNKQIRAALPRLQPLQHNLDILIMNLRPCLLSSSIRLSFYHNSEDVIGHTEIFVGFVVLILFSDLQQSSYGKPEMGTLERAPYLPRLEG